VGGFSAGAGTLDTVLRRSANKTNELLKIGKTGTQFQTFRHATTEDSSTLMIQVDDSSLKARQIQIGGTAFNSTNATAFGMFNTVAGLQFRISNINGQIECKTHKPIADNTYDFGDYSTPLRFRHLYLSGQVSFGANVNEGWLKKSGAGLILQYGSLGSADFGYGCGVCSGAQYHIDIESDGQIEITPKILRILDDSFNPTGSCVQIQGVSRTSGHVLEVIGTAGILTTGLLLGVWNDGSGGVVADAVFSIDKNGLITIRDSTFAEAATIQRTLTDFILDSGAGARLSIKARGTEVIGDNSVSALVLGNTGMAPQLPVLTTAQRNALTATTGMIVWHTGPPARAEIYTGAAWVAL